MDGDFRVSVAVYRSRAARWRRLAAEATTPKTKDYLLALAHECDFLAGNVSDVTGEAATETEEQAGQLDTPE